jgi:hypothetical protein
MCIFSETGFMVFLNDLMHNSVSVEGLSMKIVAVDGNFQMSRVELQRALYWQVIIMTGLVL